MQQKPIPYRKTVFVCVNVREGKVACANPGRGGDEICRALKEAVKVAGLKENIRVVRSGCLDRCGEGPNVFVYPEGRWYRGVRIEDVPALAREILKLD